MSLEPGSRLGPYEVLGKLGEGGMGQVYRARDTKLNRDVAIKVLPPAFARDTDRLVRFEREAQTLAALNHSNIAQIFGVIEEPAALVMELVHGQDLSEVIAGWRQQAPAAVANGPTAAGALNVDDAISIAVQIATALEAAHEQGIIHRDLKPANVKVREDGTVKVLDFGLAKAIDSVQARAIGREGTIAADTRKADSPTILSPAVTQHGMILGTAAYMAPEQAKGRPVDQRADIWAFGVVLFEMLAGKSPFGGEGISETIARVIEREPQWSALPASTPQHLRELLARCLVKDPRRRLRDIGEARIVLESPAPMPSPAVAPAPAPARAGKMLLPFVAGTALTAAVFGAYLFFRPATDSNTSAAVRRLRLPLAVATVPAGSDFHAVISPDGLKIATLTAAGVSVRWLADGRTTELVKEEDLRQIFWSPDSRWIGYATLSGISKVSLDGGSPFLMASLRGIPGPFNAVAGNVAWFPGDRLVFATGFSGLMEVRGLGAEPVEMTAVDSMTADFHGAYPLPDGSVLTSVHTGAVIDRFEVIDGKNRVVVFKETGAALGMPIYSTTGHIVFERNAAGGSIWAIAFDLASRKTNGKPFLVLDGQSRPSISGDGQILVAAPMVPLAKGQIALMRRDGTVERLLRPEIFGRTRFPEFSRDGRNIAIALSDGPDMFAGSSLFILGDDGRNATQVTNGMDVAAGRWFPDGKRLLIETGSPLCMSGDCYSIGSRAPDDERVRPLVHGWSGDVSPDGQTLAFSGRVEGAEWDLFTAKADGTGTPVPFLGGPGWQIGARFSADGKYLAYVSNESGRPEIWVAAFPSGGKWRVSTESGYWPRWQGDGSALYFARGTSVVQVPFFPGSPPSFGSPSEVFPQGTLMQMQIMRYPFAFDVNRTGQRFVLIKNPGSTVTMTVEVMQRWLPDGK